MNVSLLFGVHSSQFLFRFRFGVHGSSFSVGADSGRHATHARPSNVELRTANWNSEPELVNS